MSRNRIDQPRYPEYDGLHFSFNMINYIRYEKYDDPVFQEICKTISECYNSEIPISAGLLNDFRIYPIPPNHELWEYLEEEVQDSANYLVFLRRDDNILVTRFGPFGDEDNFQDVVGKIHRSHAILEEVWEAVKAGQNDEYGDGSEEKAKLAGKYWMNVKDASVKLEAKTDELEGLAYKVLDKPTADKLTMPLKASTGKVLMKGVAAILLAEIGEEIGRKIAAMFAAKTAAKIATKGGSKGTSKMAIKSVPVLGLFVGMGFGAWRWSQGDTTGAGWEVMSGAAACFPGAGTATSLAIDAGLIARDVYEAKNKGTQDLEELKGEVEEIKEGFEDLDKRNDKAMAEYEFVKQILDAGFTVGKLEHELKILSDAVSILESIVDNSSSL